MKLKSRYIINSVLKRGTTKTIFMALNVKNNIFLIKGA